MRAIDADKLLENARVITSPANGWTSTGGIRERTVTETQIRQAPTITYEDLVPHGRWQSCEEDGVVVCSVCGNVETQTSYFCRCCGAKMN